MPTVITDLTPFVRGAARLESFGEGLWAPMRFSPEQMRRAEKGGHGGNAASTSGVVLALRTDGDEVSFDCRTTFPRGGGASAFGVSDGIDVVVGTTLVATLPVEDGRVVARFENPSHDLVDLSVYLPCVRGLAVGPLRVNGRVEPVGRRALLLALGDSISQGWIVGHPSCAWPVRLARELGLDLVNQSIAGGLFDEGPLEGIADVVEGPALITVAYGTNDWAHAPSASLIEQAARRYLDRLATIYPDVPTYVVGPVWRADAGEAMPSGVDIAWVESLLGRLCEARASLHFVNGLDLVPHDARLFADGRLHPSAEGAAAIARGVRAAVGEGSRPSLGGAIGRADAQTLRRPHAPCEHPAFDALVRTIWRLRQPDGCPWDKVQTHGSISRNMLEEAYEAVGAIEEGDGPHLREELGDVLMQVLLHAQIDADEGGFDIDDICVELDEKLVRRHPHVFGEDPGMQAETPDDVLGIWTDVKLKERSDKNGGAGGPAGLLDGVPRAMPALMEAQKVSKKAAAVGFEWETTADVWEKVIEERSEFEAEEHGSAGASLEFGDLLFALVNVARHEGIDAEGALRSSTEKFRRRWADMEAQAAQSHVDLSELAPDELERAWRSAKERERRNLL